MEMAKCAFSPRTFNQKFPITADGFREQERGVLCISPGQMLS